MIDTINGAKTSAVIYSIVETAKANNLPEGVYVVSVEAFSSAEKAGIKAGDVIVSFDGKDIKTIKELNDQKNTHKVGDQVKVKIIRDNQTLEIDLTLGSSK